jgi:hypothetical protein
MNLGSKRLTNAAEYNGCRLLAALFVLLIGSSAASAFDYSWHLAPPTVGDLLLPGNWSPIGVPGNSDRAIIGNGGTAQILTGSSANFAELSLGAGLSGTLQFNGGSVNVNGTFLGLANNGCLQATNADVRFQINYFGGDGNDITLTASLAPVPEPCGLALLLTSIPLCIRWRRSIGRRRRALLR